MGLLRAHPRAARLSARRLRPHHSRGRQRNELLLRNNRRSDRNEARLRQRPLPPEIRRHEPRADDDPARVPDGLRLRGHPHAHDGALVRRRTHGAHRRHSRGAHAHSYQERENTCVRARKLRCARRSHVGRRLSHNGLTGCGTDGGDWATHQLEHEIGALFDVAHGAGLAAVWGSWARYVYKEGPRASRSLRRKSWACSPPRRTKRRRSQASPRWKTSTAS